MTETPLNIISMTQTIPEIQEEIHENNQIFDALTTHEEPQDKIPAKINQENINSYYAICSSTHHRLSRNSVGKNAFYDYDYDLWFFEHKIEAELCAENASKKEKSFSVKKMPSKIVDVLLNGNTKQKNVIKIKCKYEFDCRKYIEEEKKFDEECHKYKIDKSLLLIEPPDDWAEITRKKFYWLKAKLDCLEKKKKLLDDLRIECEKKELESQSGKNKKCVSYVPQNGLPIIRIIPGELHEATDYAEKILSSNKLGIFQRGGQLVRIINEISKPKKNKVLDKNGKEIIKRSADSPLITEVDPIYLTELLGKHANWTKYDERKGDWILKDCPERVAKTLIARREWNLPVLSGIIQAPTLRDDGSILENPGYDENTGLFFDAGNISFPPILSYPSKEEAIEALNIILELLNGFPFENEESKSTAVSAILTGLIRKSIRTAPLHGFTAPKMGSGKSLLADVVGLIATGKNNSVIPQADNEAEEKKRLLSVLAEGDAIICYDNIEHPFGSPALCSVLTQETFKDRILGQNRSLTVPTNATFLATGNNLTFIGDTSTRVLLCRLDPQCERPEERLFEIDLRQYILKNRSKLVMAGLTILRAFYVAGRPKQNIPQYGRFEDWSNWVRSSLVWLGMQDPCISRKEIENADPVRILLGSLMESWYDYLGDISFTLKKAISKAESENSEDLKEKAENLLDAFREFSSGKTEINPRSLGRKLATFKNRMENGYRLEITGKYQHAETWRVRKTSEKSK